MDQHIGDAGIGPLDRILYMMGDVMPVPYGNAAVHTNMQVNVKRKTHLADQTFFNIKDSRNRNRRSSYYGNDLAARGRIQHLVQGREKQAIAVRGDDRTGEKRGPGISALPTFTAD